ncbi:porin [Chitinilyticum litopenaei]|uniref:porin n=1 Tax=Chitinilyticum litopenaei TaxID=1121276 RepID=UPI000406B8AF|nr:porin [Chitinilyticum litopenaei]
MQKIIAAAVAAAFLTPAAFAEVAITGSIRQSIDFMSLDGATNPAVADTNQTRVADQGTRIAFTGSDKLDTGGKLIWRVESGVKMGTAAGSTAGVWGGREAWVGLQFDEFGTLRVGLTDNAYKKASGSFLQALDGAFNDDSSYYGGSQLLRRMGGRSGNQIHYESPKFADMQFRTSYELGEYGDHVNTDTFDAALTYTSKVFALGATFSQANDRKVSYGKVDLATDPAKAVAGTTIRGYQVGGSVFIDAFTLSAVYENIDWDKGNESRDQDTFGLGATYKTGKFTFHGAYAWAGDVDGLKDTGADQFSLGARYSLSKATSVNLTYALLKNDKAAAFKTEAPSASVSAGQDQQLITIGVRHDF